MALRFGVLLADAPASVSPTEHLELLLRQVEAGQRNGFTQFAIGQHFLYGDVRWPQPVPMIARLAAEVGPSVRLALFVVVLPLYHPVLLAEELATLDVVTNGRLDVGLGMGYRREEFRQFGVPFAERVSRFEEAVPLLRALWTDQSVNHHGRHWTVDDATPHLRPVQQPAPPLWIGANATPGVLRSARLGDAWPIGPRMPVADVEVHLATYAAERNRLGLPVGRHPIRREIVVDRNRDEARRRFTSMTADRFRAYAARERQSLPGSTAPGEEAGVALLGSPDDIVAELLDLEQRLAIGTVIVRAHWPGMDGDDVDRYLAELRPVVEVISANNNM